MQPEATDAPAAPFRNTGTILGFRNRFGQTGKWNRCETIDESTNYLVPVACLAAAGFPLFLVLDGYLS
jgi:hypothetical protein